MQLKIQNLLKVTAADDKIPKNQEKKNHQSGDFISNDQQIALRSIYYVNQITMKKSIFKNLTTVIICVVLSAGFSSCSKKNSGDPSPTDGRTAKFTVTVTGAPSSAYISFVMVGLTSDPKEATVWKVNGAVQNNESSVSLGKNNFSGNTKTYVIESIKPLSAISVGVQCLNVENSSYKVSYKAEINGEVKNDEKDFTVTKIADFTHDYTY